MKSARISFDKKKILIIGGGMVAWKKAQSFLEEGAKIRFLAPVFCEEILEYEHDYGEYDYKCLEGIFLVYACTDKKELNHQIVKDANRRGVLCASCNFDKDASYIPLTSREFENLHIALSTNGAYPMYQTVLLDEMEQLYLEKHKGILDDLKAIRQNLITQDIDSETRHKMLSDELLCRIMV